MKYILITGVSTGIGYDAVRHLTSEGYFVFGSVRKTSDQERLERDFPQRFKCLRFDVNNVEAIRVAAAEVGQILDGQLLTCLVNNAGIAVAGPLQLVNAETFDHQLLVNVSGTRNVTNAFLPLLGAFPNRDSSLSPGKIINNSSISGVINTPINGSYCVSKHAIESLGEVYRRELMIFGIDVISIQAGPIQSEIWSKNIGSMVEFENSSYGRMVRNTNKIMKAAQSEAQPAKVISKLIQKVIETRRPRIGYVVHSRPWTIRLLKWLPSRWLDRLMNNKLAAETKQQEKR